MTSKQQNLHTGYLLDRNFTDNQQGFFFRTNVSTMFHALLQVLFMHDLKMTGKHGWNVFLKKKYQLSVNLHLTNNMWTRLMGFGQLLWIILIFKHHVVVDGNCANNKNFCNVLRIIRIKIWNHMCLVILVVSFMYTIISEAEHLSSNNNRVN